MPFLGAKKHIDRLKRLSGPEVVKIGGKVAFEGADMIRAEAHRLVSAGSVSGKHHVASKPGEPPNRDTGELQGGFSTRQTGPSSAEFRSDSDHAGIELGNSRVAARPHIRPARDTVLPKIRARHVELMSKLVKRSG